MTIKNITVEIALSAVHHGNKTHVHQDDSPTVLALRLYFDDFMKIALSESWLMQHVKLLLPDETVVVGESNEEDDGIYLMQWMPSPLSLLLQGLGLDQE